ncbi:hypothetical protein [Nocardia africana]|uniref:hypothetical protein n=1 Tax=Nocardia africana TaxID=134964 RepID=UPI000AF0C1EE|nr:hypothetical protein [Nocardia africana]MCC3317796.1 hypothetical protein [Nocardia africana]
MGHNIFRSHGGFDDNFGTSSAALVAVVVISNIRVIYFSRQRNSGRFYNGIPARRSADVPEFGSR